MISLCLKKKKSRIHTYGYRSIAQSSERSAFSWGMTRKNVTLSGGKRDSELKTALY